jgi:hypothetical protein
MMMVIYMAMLKYIAIPAELKEKFLLSIKERKGVYGGVIMESTIEAIEQWISQPELVED